MRLVGLSGVALVAAGETAVSGTERPLIAIDVGHSRSRPGAVSARGEPEFAFNRGLALVVERVVRDRGFRTRLIGEQGDIEKLSDRSAAATSAGAAFLTAEQVEYPVQINGKVRARLSCQLTPSRLPFNRRRFSIFASLSCLLGAAPRKIIVVPGRLVSISSSSPSAGPAVTADMVPAGPRPGSSDRCRSLIWPRSRSQLAHLRVSNDALRIVCSFTWVFCDSRFSRANAWRR